MAKSKKSSNLKVTISLNSLKPNDERPSVALYILDDQGNPSKKIATADGNQLLIPTLLEKKEVNIAFGPDLEDPKMLTSNMLLKYSASQIIPELRKRPLLEIPQLEWGRWFWNRVCVSGKVRKCNWFFPPIIRPTLPTFRIPNSPLIPSVSLGTTKVQEALNRLTPPIITRCFPLCHGIVEVYKRTVCCDIWNIIPRIPELIPEIPELIPRPFPDPPFPPIRRVPRNIRLAKSAIEPAKQNFMDESTVSDLKSLIALPSDQQKYDFIIARPYLIHVLCRNRTVTRKKLGETNVGLDGKFTFCFNQPLVLQPVWRRCYTTYFYKVKQWIGGQYIYVYDGEAKNAYFSSAQEAVLSTYSFLAETCGNYTPPTTGQGKRYVMLQAIGNTDTYHLHTPMQTSATGINQPLPSNAGLIDFGGQTNCPLGATLKLLLYIDPDMNSVGARYYRFSMVKTDTNGNATGTPQILDREVAWRKFINGTFPPKLEAVALGPKLIGGEEGLYQIPYVSNSNKWLGNQVHYKLDTTDFADGNYNLMVELFDNAGNRIKPNGSTGAGNGTDFHYLKWKDSDDTEVVDYATLIHNIRINNKSCFADIEDLRKDYVPNREDCQFMVGNAASTFTTGFRAYHEDGFMKNFQLDYRKGLNGSDIVFDSGNDNHPALLSVGDPAVSVPVQFDTMLAGDPKCTFSLDLYVEAKHTNGVGFIQGYDARDEASFALEIE